MYIKKGWLGFVVAKNSWNSKIQFHGGKNQNKYAFKKSVPQNLKIRDHQNLKKGLFYMKRLNIILEVVF